MFYEKQDTLQQENYKKMLSIIGNLTELFSESDCPYLPYRVHENTFCKYFEAKNLAREDSSADAVKDKIGVGLKTWVGQDDQKVAEFGKLRSTYEGLTGLELVTKIAEYRNERIRVTKNLHGIESMIYHIVKRIPGAMQICECAFDYIDLTNLTIINDRGGINNTYFTDGKHTYHFSTSKNTLYMLFTDMVLLDTFEVEIMDDPYDFLMNIMNQEEVRHIIEKKKPKSGKTAANQICLRLYSVKPNGEKFVAEKSGINQWNASGRQRNENELYIPYPSEDRKRKENFFPPRDTPFELTLPDGKVIPAKVCQENSKAIMSNPNRVLGEWLLRNVFELTPRTIVTYDMLQLFGIDCVIFTKTDELKYTVDFGELGTYETFYEIEE